MSLTAILHDFAAQFERVPDGLPLDGIPVPQTPQPIRQDDEEISR